MEWTSVATRQYRMQNRAELNLKFTWSHVGLGLILRDAGSTTTQ
jgi:hypothetical protein